MQYHIGYFPDFHTANKCSVKTGKNIIIWFFFCCFSPIKRKGKQKIPREDPQRRSFLFTRRTDDFPPNDRVGTFSLWICAHVEHITSKTPIIEKNPASFC